jgi:hypothetical protein
MKVKKSQVEFLQTLIYIGTVFQNLKIKQILAQNVLAVVLVVTLIE